MTDQARLRSIDAAMGAAPPSVLFQQLSSDYPELPRRVVGEVLSRVYGVAWDPARGPEGLPLPATAARTLLDAMRVRRDEAARRIGAQRRGPRPGLSAG